MFKSVVQFDRIYLHFSESVGFLGRRPDRWFFASTRDRGRPNRRSCLFLSSYSVNSLYLAFICQASSRPSLGSFCRRLLRSACLRSCLRPFRWWSLCPHWVVRFHPCDIGLDSTGHHLLGHNWCKKRFCARQQTKSWSPVQITAYQGRIFFLCFHLLDFFFPSPHVAFL